MKRLCSLLLLLTLATQTARAKPVDPIRVLAADKLPQDSRLGKPRDLNGYFPMTPPASKEAWEKRRQELRRQVLVATGLWPLPESAPLKPVIHGKIDRDGYTIEKVFFASYPGHYVCGNLYRPKGKSGRLPAVLSPHGHWPNGRFYDAQAANGPKSLEEQIKQGAEKTIESARYPLQARCAQLARMGCVVFHYDMVGYADSQQIVHREGFKDAEAELRLQSFMGLQTYNSVRALDFLLSLPDVDPGRIGVTGASGGGTQTFILCAIDDRPAAAFPAVMVSTAMQGGCVCENCSYLRQATGNVELAGVFAPKPLGMSAANDWTKEIETKGLPELKALYKLYGAEDRVMAKCFLQFGHNYNQVSRELMYNWFNKHLHLDQPEPVTEKPFVPVPPSQLTVFDAQHPRPADARRVDDLRKVMTEMSERQLAALNPKDSEGLAKFRDVVGTALAVMVQDRLPAPEEVEVTRVGQSQHENMTFSKLLLSRKGMGEQIPAVLVTPADFQGTVVIWAHPAGKASLMEKGKLTAEARLLLEKKTSILAPDLFLTGEFGTSLPSPVNATYAGFTFGYNRPLVANRVHDLLTVIAFARGQKEFETIDLVGFDKAGPWALLARSLSGDAVARMAVDMNGFNFKSVKTTGDEMMLPGALKYGGLPSFAALGAPLPVYLYNLQGTGSGKLIEDAYRSAGAAGPLKQQEDKASMDSVVNWLLP